MNNCNLKTESNPLGITSRTAIKMPVVISTIKQQQEQINVVDFISLRSGCGNTSRLSPKRVNEGTIVLIGDYSPFLPSIPIGFANNHNCVGDWKTNMQSVVFELTEDMVGVNYSCTIDCSDDIYMENVARSFSCCSRNCSYSLSDEPYKYFRITAHTYYSNPNGYWIFKRYNFKIGDIVKYTKGEWVKIGRYKGVGNIYSRSGNAIVVGRDPHNQELIIEKRKIPKDITYPISSYTRLEESTCECLFDGIKQLLGEYAIQTKQSKRMHYGDGNSHKNELGPYFYDKGNWHEISMKRLVRNFKKLMDGFDGTSRHYDIRIYKENTMDCKSTVFAYYTLSYNIDTQILSIKKKNQI